MPILATNPKAKYDYHFHDLYEAGMVLSGQEVKSVRLGNVRLKGSFVVLKHHAKQPELFLINAHISAYKHARSSEAYDPGRSRKLLLHRREIQSLIGKIHQKGLTMIPLKMYTQGSRIKLEFALASGKKKYDKRETIRKREVERQIRRNLKSRVR